MRLAGRQVDAAKILLSDLLELLFPVGLLARLVGFIELVEGVHRLHGLDVLVVVLRHLRLEQLSVLLRELGD